MEKQTLKTKVRKILGRKVKSLRKEGILPANVYGKNVKSCAIQVEEKEFAGVFAKVGETGLLTLLIDGEKKPVLIHNIAYHPVTQKILHVDFHQVDLKEKVTARIPLVAVGEAKAVKDRVGVLLTILSEIEVEALPADLPDKLEVDISNLSAIDESIKVEQLKVSDKIKVLTDPNLEIVKVAPLVSKEAEKMVAEEKAAAQAAAAVPPEVPIVPTQAKPTEEAPKEVPKETPPQTKPTA